MLGGVALLAAISFTAYQFIAGPLAVSAKVTQNNNVKAHQAMIGRTVITDASGLTDGGDCDLDGFIEPRLWRDAGTDPAPTNGGWLPEEFGTTTIDPWGMEYGYCAWDVGTNIPLPDPDEDVVVNFLTAASSSTCVVNSDNALVCWGTEARGELGDGNTETDTVLTPTESDGDEWQFISKSYGDTTCGIKTDGSAWCWGRGTSGQLGNGASSNSASPVEVSGSYTWEFVTSGSNHNCGIQDDGTGWCWGAANNGALGTGATSGTYNTPQAISGGGTWKKLAAGSAHTCGIKEDDGQIYCWGVQNSGRLGNGNTASGNEYTPVLITESGPWIDVTASGQLSCGVKTNGTGWCWGKGQSGSLGDGVGGDHDEPDPIQILDAGPWEKIEMSQNTGCGIKSDGSGWCWGQNANGTIGDGTKTNRNTPVEIDGSYTWLYITGNSQHTCGIRTNRSVMCWGQETGGRLGNGATASEQLSPIAPGVSVTNGYFGSGASEISVSIDVSANHSCTIKYDGTPWCWGKNDYGQAGDSDLSNQPAPVAVSGGGAWKLISSGTSHSCGIKSDDTAWCWGNAAYGKMGNGVGTSTSFPAPVAVSGGGTWKTIDAGSDHTCGVKTDDTAWCWGNALNGRLGNGVTSGSQTTPVEVSGGFSWETIEAGNTTSCGVLTNGTGKCWGSAANGKLANGTTSGTFSTPVTSGGAATWKMISPTTNHTCGIKSDDTAWCWGSASNGYLGNGATSGNQMVPVTVSGGGTWIDISAGNTHTCAVKSDNTAWCWGTDSFGKLGNGGLGTQTTPSAVIGGHSWSQISADGNHTCGLKTDNSVYCWGYDAYGQVGNGAVTGTQSSPVEVSGMTGGTPSTSGVCTDTLIDGADDPTTGNEKVQSVIAIVSAGPDRAFSTTCSAYVDDSTSLVTTSGDDIVKLYTYAEAAIEAMTLWQLKSGDDTTAEIDKDLSIGSNIEFDIGNGLIEASIFNTSGKTMANGGVMLADENDVTTCTASEEGLVRFNTTDNTPDICRGVAGWQSMSSFPFPTLAPNGSAAAPSYSFTNSTSGGLYYDGSSVFLSAPTSGKAALQGGSSILTVDNSAITIESNGTLSIYTYGSDNAALGNGGTDFRIVSQGGIQIGDTTAACSATLEGTLKYLSATKDFEFCDGTDWVSLTAIEEEEVAASETMKVFITSDVWKGSELGVFASPSSDERCQDAATTAGLTGVFRAWHSNTIESPATKFDTSGGPYALLNGTEIATDWADLTDGTIDADIIIDENNTTIDLVANPYVWTNVDTDGTTYSSAVADRCSFDSDVSKRSTADNTSAGWTTPNVSSACSLQGHLYCFEQPPLASTGEDPTERVVFVHNGTTGMLTGAATNWDGFCQVDAGNKGLAGNYMAWISDSTSSPSTRFTQASVPYVLVDGTQIADDWADLTDGTLDAPINLDAVGSVYFGTIQTGTTTSGTHSGSSCSDWTTASMPSRGDPTSTSSTWTDGYIGMEACNNAMAFYCFEQGGSAPEPPEDKVIFLSSAQYTGNLGGLSGADATCQSLASSAGLTGTFKAWLSDSSSSPAVRFTQSTSDYVDTVGNVIANGWSDLTNGSIDGVIEYSETGNRIFPVIVSDVWTNTNGAGGLISGGVNCSDWTTSSGGSNRGNAGTRTATDSTWTDSGNPQCNSAAHLYCVEQ